jgi:hypothetical protein
MTQAQHTTTRSIGFIPAAFAALLMAAVLGTAIALNGLPRISFAPAAPTVTTDQAVLESGQQWEQQRRIQMGIGVNRATLESGVRWEGQRKAQSGAFDTTYDDDLKSHGR